MYVYVMYVCDKIRKQNCIHENGDNNKITKMMMFIKYIKVT